MACNNGTYDNSFCTSCGNGTFDQSNLLFFFLALCALSGNGCSQLFSGGNELLIFFLLLALLFSNNGTLGSSCNCNRSCGTC